MLKEDQREKRAAVASCASHVQRTKWTPLPYHLGGGERWVQDTHSPPSVHSKGTVAAPPVTEFVFQLSSRQIWGNMLRPDMKTPEEAWRRGRKNVLCPVNAAELCTALLTPSVFLCVSPGSRPEGLCRNEYPTGSAHKCNTVGILCTWEECLLSMINERITITQLRIHGTGIVWGTLRNAASRQESMDCSLKAIYTTR